MKYQVSTDKFPVIARFFPCGLTTLLAIVASVCCNLLVVQANGPRCFDEKRGVTDYQLQIEFLGNVTPQATPENPEPVALPLDVKAEFRFSQSPFDASRVIREYNDARAEIVLQGLKTTSELLPSNKKLFVQLADKRYSRPIQFTSAGGLLKQTELDLITTPGDPLSFHALFENRRTQSGEQWQPSDQAVRAFLAVENVIENDLVITVKETSNGTSKVYLTGDVKAEVDGATAKYQVSGLALVDERDGSVKGLRLTIDENRTAGQIAPAFDGRAKVDLRANPVASSTKPNAVNAEYSPAGTRLLWSSESEFELVYDPRWKVILADSDSVIMRFADQGNVLAQCSMMPLSKRPSDRPLSLDDFRGEIEKLLRESPAKLMSATTSVSPSGLTVHKLVISGMQDEIEIDWLYCHIANSDGRRLAMIFTLEHEIAESFGNADQRLIDAVRFVSAKTAELPTKENAK